MPVTFIYALNDPRVPEQIRYVGKTVSALRERLYEHLQEVRREPGRNHRHRWLAALVKAGLRPEIFLLEEVATLDDWAAREQHWISTLRAAGHRLTNSTEGGEGALGHSPSEETRAKMSAAHKGNKCALGLRHSEATKEKLRVAHTGRKFTSEHREKLGLARLGKKRAPFSQEWRTNMSLSLRGKKRRPLTAAHKEKLRRATLKYFAEKRASGMSV